MQRIVITRPVELTPKNDRKVVFDAKVAKCFQGIPTRLAESGRSRHRHANVVLFEAISRFRL